MKLQVFILSLTLLAACSSVSEPVSISKESLQGSNGKADASAVAALCEQIYGEPCDLCERQGWYGDGLCDAFCQSPDPDCGAGSCVYDGDVHSDGDRFDAVDGCNTCDCEEGEVFCTELYCPPTAKSCVYNGMTYEDGEGFPSVDGCNGCGCHDGLVSCTELYCEPDPGTCTVDGVVYANGAGGVPDPDSCNTCSCIDGQVTDCTEIHCPNPPPGEGSCVYYGNSYSHGQGFDAADGCNRCECDNGAIRCTELWCGEPKQGYACADKLCGAECKLECPADEPNCVLPAVQGYCAADGYCEQNYPLCE